MLGSRTGCLLDRDAVVTWADLDVQDVEVAPLLAEDGLATSTKSRELQGHMAVDQMHSHLKVQSRRHVHSEVVRLEHWLAGKNLR